MQTLKDRVVLITQVGFMKSLAVELAPRGIRVNTVKPRPVKNGFQNDVEERAIGLATSSATAFRVDGGMAG